MEIQKDHVVTFHYRISEEGQTQVLEDNHDSIPMAFLCGHGNILKGLEDALLGKQAGDELQVTLAPEEAYGHRREDSNQKVPIKHLLNKPKRLLPGTYVKVNGQKGPLNAQVVKAGKFMVELDFNHPFAGKTLVFDIKVAEVRVASEEELSHGHAHGVGGHHH